MLQNNEFSLGYADVDVSVRYWHKYVQLIGENLDLELNTEIKGEGVDLEIFSVSR